jgi:uncharacterized glyoxalase superfamily protein PhnB
MIMSNQVNPVPEGFHTVTPTMTVKNSIEAIEFYQQAFNAENLGVFPTPDGEHTMHAVIKIGNSILMMGDEMPGMGCPSASPSGSSPISLYIYVEDADALFAQAVAAGAEKVMPVEDAFWGDRCGMVKDPFGYSWMIATHNRDLSEEEIQKGAKEFFEKHGKK